MDKALAIGIAKALLARGHYTTIEASYEAASNTLPAPRTLEDVDALAAEVLEELDRKVA